MKDIHDIRPPVMAGLDPDLVRYGLWALAGLAALLVLAWLARRLWKQRGGKGEETMVPQIPPIEAALAALEALKQNPSTSRAFYFQLSGILKAYLGDRLLFHAREMTTPELARALGNTPLPPNLANRISQFQKHCDPLRYAPEPDAAIATAPTIGDGKFNNPSDLTADLARVEALVKEVDAALTPVDSHGADAAGDADFPDIPRTPAETPLPVLEDRSKGEGP